MSESQTSKDEVEFACGHSVSHEEECPRCTIERLTGQLKMTNEMLCARQDQVELLRAALTEIARLTRPRGEIEHIARAALARESEREFVDVGDGQPPIEL